MLPYWLLLLVFVIGAAWFPVRRAVTAPNWSPLPPSGTKPSQQTSYRSKLLLAAALLPAIMIGLRYDVGTDWGAYADIFEWIKRRGLGFAFSRIDPGYGFLNWIVAALGVDFWLVNVICGLLFMYGIVRFAREQTNPWLAIVVSVPYLIIGVGMGYSRQAVAIGLSMVGLATVAKTGFGRFVLWVLAGALFHRTAVILIPIVALSYARNRFQVVVLGFVACIIGYYMLTLGQGIEQFQLGYIARVYESQGAAIRLAMNLPPALIYLAASRRFTYDETERRTWRNFSIIAVASFFAYFFIASSAPLDRMALYIIPLQLFVFSRLPHAFGGVGQASALLTLSVVTYSALVQYVWLNYSNNAQFWLPYRLFPLWAG